MSNFGRRDEAVGDADGFSLAQQAAPPYSLMLYGVSTACYVRFVIGFQVALNSSHHFKAQFIYILFK